MRRECNNNKEIQSTRDHAEEERERMPYLVSVSSVVIILYTCCHPITDSIRCHHRRRRRPCSCHAPSNFIYDASVVVQEVSSSLCYIWPNKKKIPLVKVSFGDWIICTLLLSEIPAVVMETVSL